MTMIKLIVSLLLQLSLTSLLHYFKSCYAVTEGLLSIENGYSCDPFPDSGPTTPAFRTNMNNLLNTLETNAPENYGFYMAAEGEKHDRVYGLVQCRGDVSATDCATCVNQSVNWATARCRTSNAASIWLDLCFLRLSHQNFLGQVSDSMRIAFLKNSSRGDDSSNGLTKGQNLMSELAADVPYEPFRFKTGSVDVGSEGKRYGLMQCNRDLSEVNCQNCTTELLRSYLLTTTVNRSIGLRYIFHGCRLWYDDYKFYFNYTLPTVAPNDIPIPKGGSSMKVRSSFSGAILMILLALTLVSS